MTFSSQFSKTLGLAGLFQFDKTQTCVRQDTNSWDTKLVWKLFNYPSLSYIVHALSSAVTNLSNEQNFDLPWLSTTHIFFNNIPGLENEILKFHDFLGFP